MALLLISMAQPLHLLQVIAVSLTQSTQLFIGLTLLRLQLGVSLVHSS